MAMSATARRRVRVVFAVAVLVLPLQMGVRKVVGEPYPAIFQPSFRTTPAQGSFTDVFDPIIVADYDDGTSRSFTERELFNDSEVLPSTVFKTAFETHANEAGSAEVRSWLEHRLAELGKKSDVEKATISWRTAKYSLKANTPPTYITTKTVVMPLEGEG
jgi:hypothetical protein